MNEEIRTQLKEYLEMLIKKANETKSTQELVSLSEQIYKIASVLLSKNYN